MRAKPTSQRTGGGQTWDPARYARNAGFVIEGGLPVLDLLAAKPGERVLDLGCGDGTLTAKLAEIGCPVVAVDSSPAQVAAARAKGLDARVADARDLGFRQEFDAVFSNAALHWMGDLASVLAAVFRALKPGGRFVGEMGGEGNVAAIRAALGAALKGRGIDPEAVDPWYFPSLAEFREKLEDAGFRVSHIELFERPSALPGTLEAWLETFGESFLMAVAEADRPAFVDEVRKRLAPVLERADGTWFGDYVRLRFAARRP